MPRKDPYRSFRFLVEIEGILQGGFTECSGMGSSLEVVEYREGGDGTVRKLPGKVAYSDITLKWGLTDSRDLYDWHLSALNGQTQRRHGSVILRDDRGQEKLRWNFFNAWPSKWEGPSFNSTGNEVAVSTLTMSCERVQQAL